MIGLDDAVYKWVHQQVMQHLDNIATASMPAPELVEIPVCYDKELNNDLAAISLATGLAEAEIIDVHCNKNYYVYMLGFLPGFAYMGEVAPALELPRKPKPVKVKPGAVAIAGKQTGIYPLDSFGGWHVLGYTPVKMFDQTRAEPCFLNAGQEVKFYPVSIEEYHQFTLDALN